MCHCKPCIERYLLFDLYFLFLFFDMLSRNVRKDTLLNQNLHQKFRKELVFPRIYQLVLILFFLFMSTVTGIGPELAGVF